MAKSGWYAVAAGRSTGVFTTWAECAAQVKGFTDCKYKKFTTQREAQAFIDAHNCPQAKAMTKRPSTDSKAREDGEPTQKRNRIETPTSTTVSTPGADTFKVSEGSWYAVAKGRKTGVFRTWKEAKKQVEHLFSAKFKKFASREQAQAFVDQYAGGTTKQEEDLDPKDPNTLVAFCDGSALENGRQHGRAGYACIFPHCKEWNVAIQLVEERATNNRAEYMAALEAMKRANLEDPKQSRTLLIFSDSMLLIRSMTEWVTAWKVNNWTKSDGAPVLNRDLLEKLVAETGSRQIEWTHVKAHTGRNDWRSKWNDVADNAARNAALRVCNDELGKDLCMH